MTYMKPNTIIAIGLLLMTASFARYNPWDAVLFLGIVTVIWGVCSAIRRTLTK